MKKIISIFCTLTLICFCLTFLTGCTYKTYHLAGVYNEETGETIRLQDADSETLEYIYDTLGTDPTIKLQQNGTFLIKYTLYDVGAKISYEHTGTFKINEDEKTIIFSFPTGTEGKTSDVTHQYENEKIIYFDGVHFLVFN